MRLASGLVAEGSKVQGSQVAAYLSRELAARLKHDRI